MGSWWNFPVLNHQICDICKSLNCVHWFHVRLSFSLSNSKGGFGDKMGWNCLKVLSVKVEDLWCHGRFSTKGQGNVVKMQVIMGSQGILNKFPLLGKQRFFLLQSFWSIMTKYNWPNQHRNRFLNTKSTFFIGHLSHQTHVLQKTCGVGWRLDSIRDDLKQTDRRSKIPVYICSNLLKYYKINLWTFHEHMSFR